jgi:hypothetical protein
MFMWLKKLFFNRAITRTEVEEKINEALGVKWLQSMQRLDVKNGDIIVIRYPGVLSTNAKTYFRESVRDILKDYGYDVRVMIFEEGSEIGILRRDNT